LKADIAEESVTKDGNAFQTRTPATGKERSPIVVLRVDGTTSAGEDVDCSRRLVPLSATRCSSSDRYAGAVPYRQRTTSTENIVFDYRENLRLGILTSAKPRSGPHHISMHCTPLYRTPDECVCEINGLHRRPCPCPSTSVSPSAALCLCACLLWLPNSASHRLGYTC